MNPSESSAGWSSDRGVAMIATLLVLMLVSALLVGFTAVIMGDQRYRGIDKDRNVAFYGAQAGLEKLSADLGNLFFVNLAPTSAQVNALTVDANKPPISGINYTQSDGTSGYYISFADDDGDGHPDARNGTVKSGTYTGLIALLTDYTLNAVARTTAGSEVHLQKGIQTVADSGLSVRHVLGRRPQLLRRRELQLRRARAHQRQPVSRRRRARSRCRTR